MCRHVIAVLPLLVFFTLRLAGQIDSSEYEEYSGLIIDDSLGFSLPSVHLWNESTRMGTISNDSGEFKIRVRDQDTIVFSILGYLSKKIVVSPSTSLHAIVRLKPRKYEIGEVVVRRFRSYESFKYQVLHLELPESEIVQLKDVIDITSAAVALEADRERTVNEKLETGRLGYLTPLGKGIDREKAFKEKMHSLEKRKRIIQAKFNRELVGDITKLEGDELTEFIAMCNFSDEYIYETDLYTIMEVLYQRFDEYQSLQDTIPSSSED
jgi:hypothetical protein